MRESAAVKGRRLLAEGRLTVIVAGDPARPGLIVAECKGDSGAVYALGYDHRGREWRCTCPALTSHCSHLTALQLVVRREP
jgi:uncharacterized Zn finger protein